MGTFAAQTAMSIKGVQTLPTASGFAIDRAKLDEQTFGDLEIRRDILTLFQAEAPALLLALAATSGGPRAEIAHRLKGSALAIGATGLADVAARLEAMPDGEGLPGAVEAALADVLREIANLLAS